jgi:cobalt-zinc-cadmium efflux system membrane fusion protein
MGRRGVGVVVIALLGMAAAWAEWTGRVSSWMVSWFPGSQPVHSDGGEDRFAKGLIPGAELVEGEPDAVRLPPGVVTTLGIATAPVRVPERSRILELSGSLALDTSLLAHVHTRFDGEVVELGTVVDPGSAGGTPVRRPLRFGDQVEKGQLLAVLWSNDLGERKSEYVDALSRLRIEKETLARLEALFRDESIPERTVREARRQVESAQIAVARVERTLRSWRVAEEEIQAIRREAEAMSLFALGADAELEKLWARVELRAPLSGTILEVNLAVGDIVTTETDLFKIADMTMLRAWAFVYEEDLPALLALPRPIRWSIGLKADPTAPPIIGTVEKIGDIIDPNQHTALVVGQVENPSGRMRAGQFITAWIDLPPDPNELEIPIAALVEDGEESVVLVQPDAEEPIYVLRRVLVTRRLGKTACVRGGSFRSLGEGPSAVRSPPLQLGDRVVVSGAVELRAALAGLQDAADHGDEARRDVTFQP